MKGKSNKNFYLRFHVFIATQHKYFLFVFVIFIHTQTRKACGTLYSLQSHAPIDSNCPDQSGGASQSTDLRALQSAVWLMTDKVEEARKPHRTSVKREDSRRGDDWGRYKEILRSSEVLKETSRSVYIRLYDINEKISVHVIISRVRGRIPRNNKNMAWTTPKIT